MYLKFFDILFDVCNAIETILFDKLKLVENQEHKWQIKNDEIILQKLLILLKYFVNNSQWK